MVHLAPTTVHPLENSCCPNVEVSYDLPIAVGAAFSPHGPKYILGAMNGVVHKFNMHVRSALEYRLIHLMRLVRATPNSAQRIVDRDCIRVSEILVHHVQIAGVKRTIELRQCLTRLIEVSEWLIPRDGFLYEIHYVHSSQ